ncbi:hypothetical protein HQ590_13285, partial [bacterium]|nr:hypothetical protein [bacterium]
MGKMRLRQYLLTRRQQPENAYGSFAQEILVAEGLTGFETVDVDQDGLPDFQPSDVVILTRCFPHIAEIEQLAAAVERGVRLVCFQPSPRLAERFGWNPRKSVVLPGWVRIREGCPGAGLPIQAHVPAALYDPAEQNTGWQAIADAVRPDWTEAGAPAVVRQAVGQGELVLFFYDLPAAVARIRFGNPELASYLTTGLWRWWHACDLFVGHVDERVKHLPQADFHGQLLAKVLTDVASYPLARLWYYPQAAQRSVAIVQSDDDGSTPEQFQEISECLRARGGTATFYLVHTTLLSEQMVRDLRGGGHTFAPHADPHRCTDERCFDFPRILREETADFKRRFGDCSSTIQCHCAPWHGYLDWVPMFRQEGYRLLFAYLAGPTNHWHTYMCGSGRPLRFCDQTGQLHDCW